ncbi:methyl-accepting chemotaxis protein [Psychromonas ossibalaenae]|uniref:methyl-accepting chemotaxis protein n=1 Tax=Psychromonas ossibalaenae TaxID=444922 RepID=UPI000360682E|nr:methyl-accepting chemotaxis protein [Psychromonas ossibalaenae]
MKSIKAIFVVQVVVAVTVVLLLSSYLKYNDFKQDLYSSLDVDIENTASRLTVSLPRAIWDFDLDTARLAISAELKLPEVTAIKIIDNQDADVLFLMPNADNADELAVDVADNSLFPEENSVTEALVFIEDEEKNDVGKVIVYFETTSLEAKLSASLYRSVIELLILDIIISLLIIAVLAFAVLRPLTQLTERIQNLASGEGDLSNKIPAAKLKEFHEITEGINEFTASLRIIVLEVTESSGQLEDRASASGEMARASADRLSQQKHQLSTVAAAATELNHSVGTVTDTAGQTADEASTATLLAGEVYVAIENSAQEIINMREEMNHVNTEMHKLVNEGEKISTVLNVINDISGQTNLLALNAAIEAARAGEQGRGFAVVADEVRNLAVKTGESTEQIQKNISSLDSATKSVEAELTRIAKLLEKTAERVSESQSSVSEVSGLIEHISDKSSQISQATEEQKRAVEEISQAIVEASEASNMVSDGAAKNAQRTDEVLKLSNNIVNQMSKFRT